MRSQIARQMANCLRLRSINFMFDIRFMPRANLVKVLVEISFIFTTVVAAISLTSMQHLLLRRYHLSGGQFFNDFGAARYDLAPDPGEIFFPGKFRQMRPFGSNIAPGTRYMFRVPVLQKLVEA